MDNLDFYDAGALRQIATNLFYGWGYNFYRLENQLRADDQLIRAKAASLLSSAAESIGAAESDYRREFLPAPSRARPFPDPKAVSAAQQLERLGQAVRAVGNRLCELPVPENDRMTQRFRDEALTLNGLITQDQQLVGQCELLRSTLDRRDATWVLEHTAEVQIGLGAIEATLQNRQMLLLNA